MSYQQRQLSPDLQVYAGPGGVLYYCARVSEIPESEVTSNEQSRCPRCAHRVWVDRDSWIAAAEQGTVKVICIPCYSELGGVL